MRLWSQARLLRVLQEGLYGRVGGEAELRFSGRIVATTLRPLDRGDRSGFCADLYHRLAGCVLRVPPLSERREDIPALAAALPERARPAPRQGVIRQSLHRPR